jgi:hypothetical protein
VAIYQRELASEILTFTPKTGLNEPHGQFLKTGDSLLCAFRSLLGSPMSDIAI